MDFTALDLSPFGLGVYNVKDPVAREELTHKVAYAEYNRTDKVIVFYNTADDPTSGNILCYIDARDFIKDGMVDSVVVEDGNLVITFNTESGKEPISIPLTDIFNPDLYYTKTEMDAAMQKKANTDGWYPRMVVGAAESLIGKDISVDEATDYVVQGATGIAKVNEVMGRSEKWNQMVRNMRNFGTEFNGLTITYSADGKSLTVNGTATANTDNKWMLVDDCLSAPQIANHVYLFKGCPAGGSATTYRVLDRSGRVSIVDYGNGSIAKCMQTSGGNSFYIAFDIKEGTVCNNLVFTPMLFDLTDIYGEGNEPTTVEQFAADVFAKYGKTLDEYFEYDAGSINNANVESLKVYDDNDTLRTELPINIKTITGKVNGEGESVTIFSNGMRGVGSAYDSLIVDEDGWCRRAVRRVGSVDLGNFTYNITSNVFFTTITGRALGKTELICPIYIAVKSTVSNLTDGQMMGATDSARVYFKNSAYTDAATFKAAMQGVPLVYKLAEPIEYVLDEPILMTFNAYNGGVIRQIKDDMELATRLNITFALNVQGFINNANKDFVSAASMQAFLTKLSSAKGGTWGMTYNSTTQQYEFTYTDTTTNSTTNLDA